MRRRRIGDIEVGEIALGTAPMTLVPEKWNEWRALATIHAALDAGITLLDTADTYAPAPDALGYGERLVRQALASYTNNVEVLTATKFGHVRTSDGAWRLDGRPEHVRRACELSLHALGVEAIGLYQYHRPDDTVPYAETIGAVKELQQEGKVRLVGISNANLDQIKIAQEVLGGRGLASVQNEFSLSFRSNVTELRYCLEHGISFLPYRPLGGVDVAPELASRLPLLGKMATSHGVSPQRVCLAWMLMVAPNVIPVVGATRPETVSDSAAATDLKLTLEEVAMLDGFNFGTSSVRSC